MSSPTAKFKKVSQSLKYDSIFFVRKHINIYYMYMDTNTDHFTSLALLVRGKNDKMYDCNSYIVCIFVFYDIFSIQLEI